MTAALPQTSRPPHPVFFGVEYDEHQDRWKTFLRLFLAIPQLIVVYVLQTVFSLLSFFAWFAILFTGRYPRGLFDLSVGILRWSANVVAYVSLLRDEYPPFSLDPGRYPVVLDIPYPEHQSRFRLFVRFITIVPQYIVFSFVQVAWAFVTMLAWFSLLVGAKYPQRFFGFSVGTMRWYLRQQSYLYLLRDEYPPYRFSNTAPPDSELASGIVGAPLLAVYIAVIVVFASIGGHWRGNDTIVVRASYENVPRGETSGSEELAAYDYGVYLRLDRASDPDISYPSLQAAGGYRFIGFYLTIGETFGRRLRIAEGDFVLKDGLGEKRKPTLAVLNGLTLPETLRGNRGGNIALLFEVDESANPVELRYQPDRIEYSPFAGDPQVRPIAYRFVPP